MSIRSATKNDLPHVIELYRTCFAEPPWYEVFDSVELEQEFTEMLTWSDCVFLVYEQRDKIVGCAIGFSIHRKPDVQALVINTLIDRDIGDKDVLRYAKAFYAAELFVDPSTRNRGICGELNKKMLLEARAKKFDCVMARTSVNQLIIQHLYLDVLHCNVIAKQKTVSTKMIDGKEVLTSDMRVIMAGSIPYPSFCEN